MTIRDENGQLPNVGVHGRWEETAAELIARRVEAGDTGKSLVIDVAEWMGEAYEEGRRDERGYVIGPLSSTIDRLGELRRQLENSLKDGG